MKLKHINGFSLMEMMVVLLIVAIVMAASAPMVSRKMIRASAGDGGCNWEEVSDGIAYYESDKTVMIGTQTISTLKPKLRIKSGNTVPHIELENNNNKSLSFVYTDNDGVGFTDLTVGPKSVTIGKSAKTQDTNDGGIAIGYQSVSDGNYSIAIGDNAKASDTSSIAIGDNAQATDMSSIAIGDNAAANGADCIAIGTEAQVKLEGEDAINTGNSIAIGTDVIATAPNTIELGNSAQTVHIAGNLIVDGDVELAKEKTVKIQAGDTYDVLYDSNEENRKPVYISDRRLKNVGDVYKGGLEELKKLVFYHYTFKNDNNKTPHVGVMAQDLQRIFPEAVLEGNNGFLKIRPEYMFYAVINAVKELDAKYTALAEQIKSNLDLTAKLQAKVDSQEKEIAELKKLTKELEKRLEKLEK